MPRKPNNRQVNKEDHENKLIIEKWMKRNSSNKVVINKKTERLDKSEKKPIPTLPYDIKVTQKKKVVIPVGISESKLNKLTSIKRVHSLPIQNDEPKVKICRQSLPNKGASVTTFRTKFPTNNINKSLKSSNKTKPSIEIISPKGVSKIIPEPTKLPSITTPIIEVIKNTNNTKGKEVNNLSTSTPIINFGKSSFTAKGNQIVKNVLPSSVKYSVIEVSSGTKGKQIVKKDLSPSIVKSNLVKTSNVKVSITSSENNVDATNGANNEVNNSLKQKDDVYTSLLENYRYLVIPKDWSVNEFTNEVRNRYIVFFNTQVIEEKSILISVIKKSLIIDKGGTMNYSVHGLPIDIKGTILPKTLDNTKKLLSILHIFDKMQVCEGIGSDFKVVQSSVIFKDCYRHLRHKNCKIILIKATRCLECTEARNFLKRRSELQPNAVKQEIEFVDVSIKTEQL